MKKGSFAPRYFLAAVVVACLSVLFIGWQDRRSNPEQTQKNAVNDTIPKKKIDKKVRDLDDVLDELDRAELKLNMDKVKKEIEEAMKNINTAKISMDVQKAMKDVDMEKIKAEIEKSMKEIDWDKIKVEMEELKKVDMAKVQDEMKKVEEEMKKIGPQIEKEMAELKKVDMAKVQDEMKKVEEEMKKLGPQIEKELEKAKVEIEKAREEIKEYKSFVDGLEKDGVIDKKKDYSIRHKDGELTVNGQKQPADVYNKYRSFLEKHKKFKIEKSEDNFNIDND
jgi:chromosome segregation ATPase